MHAPTPPAELHLEAARRALDAGDRAAMEEHLLAARDDDPECAEALTRLADLALVRGHYLAAAGLMRRVTCSRPRDALAWGQLGNALWRAQKYDESFDALRHAEGIDPDHPRVQQNLGLWHYIAGSPAESVRHLARALELAPHDHWVRSDHAHAVLKSGDLRRGLELFEARWATVPRGPCWDLGLLPWDGGRDFGGKILLHHEQGFGDTIQFLRFVPVIKDFGKFNRVAFAGPLALRRLVEGQCEVDEYWDHERAGELVRAAAGATCHAPLISAVARLGLTYETLPPHEPYLAAPAASFRRLRGGARLAVGLVWAASAGHERSRQRSVGVAELASSLGSVPGVRLWSLQMAPHGREAVETGADLLIRDATPIVMDFMDTACLVQSVDVVVSVDTSVVHLCGALGKRCLMLAPLNSCWRWAKGPEPWYGSHVETFRQSADLTWGAAIAQIQLRIEEMAA